MSTRIGGCTRPALAAAIVAAVLLVQPHAERRSARLAVAATGFKSTRGQAIVAVYGSREAWLHPEKASRIQTVKLTAPSVAVDFADLAPGTYGVSVVHDENQNGKLDMRYLPVPGPREGAGVSNNVRKKMRPPSWDAAKFLVSDKDVLIEIGVVY